MCYMMNCVPSSPPNRYIEVLKTSTSPYDLFENRFFTEIVQLK